jgi:hypothetical protein
MADDNPCDSAFLTRAVDHLQELAWSEDNKQLENCANSGSAEAAFLLGISPLYIDVSPEVEIDARHYITRSSALGFAPAQAMVGGVLLEADPGNAAGKGLITKSADAGEAWAAYYRIRGHLSDDVSVEPKDVATLEAARSEGFVLAYGALGFSDLQRAAQVDGTKSTNNYEAAERKTNAQMLFAYGAALGDPLSVAMARTLSQQQETIFGVIPSEGLEDLEDLLTTVNVPTNQSTLGDKIETAHKISATFIAIFVTDNQTLAQFEGAREFCDSLREAANLQRYCEVRALADHYYCRDPIDVMGRSRATTAKGASWYSTAYYQHCRTKRLNQRVYMTLG